MISFDVDLLGFAISSISNDTETDEKEFFLPILFSDCILSSRI